MGRGYTTAMDHPALLELAARLAHDAGQAIEAIRRAGFAVETKGDSSPVTAADRLAEGVITEGLRGATPDIPIIAEEAMSDGGIPPVAPRFWLVDPLDGTKEFAAGLPEYCVCIALIENGRAVLGVLGAPAEPAIYAGILGQGAWVERNGVRTPMHARRPPAAGLVMMASRSHRQDTGDEAFKKANPVAEIIPMGSALKYARVAEGRADVVPRLNGRTMEWDTAAAQAVLEAAGGRMFDSSGGVLMYGKPNYRNEGFIAWGAE
jgi:3'(2'), 5'-bisphosphate nucleotidase